MNGILFMLKDDILKLLKEDEEFRYAVIGLLGLQRLEEAIARLVDIQARMESRLSKVEDAVTRLSDAVAKLTDIQARMEERLARVEEEQIGIKSRIDRLEDAIARLTDIQARQEERLTRVEERLEEHDRKFNEIIAEIRDLRRVSNEHTVMLRNMQGMMLHGFEQMGRFAGISLESLVRSMLTKVMQDNGELPKDKELTSITIDSEEIDVFCDDPLIVGEVTSYADSIDEVYKLVKKVKLVRDRFNKEHKRILLIITNIKRDVYEDMVREAEGNGIEIIIGKRV